MRNLASMTAQRNEILAQATELVTRGLSTKEQKAQYRTLLSQADALSDDLAALQTIDSRLHNNATAQTSVTSGPSVPATDAPVTPERRSKAYLNYFTYGYNPQSPEQRDLTTTTDGSGEALVQQDWQPQWTAALKQYGPLASLVRMVVKTSGSPTRIPLADPTSQTMTYLADAGSVDSIEVDPSVSSITPATDTLVSFTKASIQLYRDAALEGGLPGFIKDNLMGIAARALETALLSGVDGSDTTLPSNAGFLSYVPTGATTASASVVTFSELLALYSSPDAAYRNAPGAAFYASQTTHDAIAGILDSNDRPIFHFDADGILQVFGKPVWVAGTASGMPSVGTASKPIVLFGDFSRALVATQRPLQTRVLYERFVDTNELGFVSFQRVGSAAGISGSVKALVTAS
jgi:HK97 family phage major capsid protein